MNRKTKTGAKVRFRKLCKDIRRDRLLLLMFLPGLIYFVVFRYLPMGGLIMAFQDFDIFKGFFGSPIVGLKHFKTLFSTPQFAQIFMNTVLISIYTIVFSFPFPIIFALLLNEMKWTRMKKLTQTISYLPHFISVVVVAGMVVDLLSPGHGAIAQFIGALTGKEAPYLLADPKYFRTVYIITTIWQTMGWNAIIFIAALTGVDFEQYEAATMDGASRLQRMWYITLPAIKPTIVIMLILSLGKIMETGFDLIFLLQTNLNLSVSEVISTFVYKRGILGQQALPNYSFATAANLFQSLISMVLVVTSNKLSKKFSEISLW